jgi:hypothetical protein
MVSPCSRRAFVGVDENMARGASAGTQTVGEIIHFAALVQWIGKNPTHILVAWGLWQWKREGDAEMRGASASVSLQAAPHRAGEGIGATNHVTRVWLGGPRGRVAGDVIRTQVLRMGAQAAGDFGEGDPCKSAGGIGKPKSARKRPAKFICAR